MIDDIALFIHIVQNRGLASAAKRLNLPAANVTRRLQKLEDQLKTKLVHRSARKFALTGDGEAYYETFAGLVHQFETALHGLTDEQQRLHGKLKVAAPTNISVGVFQPIWSAFIREYPQIQLDLRLSNENTDLVRTQTDIALRAGPQSDTQLFQKRLASIPTLLVAAPSYLAAQGRLHNLEDLSEHRLIGVSIHPSWKLVNQETGRAETRHLIANVSVDDIGLAQQLAADGHGIVLLPLTEINDALMSGRLVRVLPNWRGVDRDFYAVWPTGRLLSARAKCLMRFIEDRIASYPVFQGVVPASITT